MELSAAEHPNSWADGARACSGVSGSIYTMVEVPASNSTNPVNVNSGDKVHVIKKPKCGETIVMTTGSGKCGTRDDGTLTPDTSFPTNGAYNGVFTMVIKPAGGEPVRIPMAHFFKSDSPPPGKKYKTVELAQSLDTTPCSVVDEDDMTRYFYKICLNSGTGLVGPARLP